MFPELDLTQTLRQFGHLNSEALASVILDTIKNIPPKRGQVYYFNCFHYFFFRKEKSLKLSMRILRVLALNSLFYFNFMNHYTYILNPYVQKILGPGSIH